ncbi:MAG TPA: hypothetical protein VLA04_00925 [Verrucomicrobiae bacterium]|nr:hypothetical protein [Verrucomicrobiae bacterium]
MAGKTGAPPKPSEILRQSILLALYRRKRTDKALLRALKFDPASRDWEQTNYQIRQLLATGILIRDSEGRLEPVYTKNGLRDKRKIHLDS